MLQPHSCGDHTGQNQDQHTRQNEPRFEIDTGINMVRRKLIPLTAPDGRKEDVSSPSVGGWTLGSFAMLASLPIGGIPVLDRFAFHMNIDKYLLFNNKVEFAPGDVSPRLSLAKRFAKSGNKKST